MSEDELAALLRQVERAGLFTTARSGAATCASASSSRSSTG